MYLSRLRGSTVFELQKLWGWGQGKLRSSPKTPPPVRGRTRTKVISLWMQCPVLLHHHSISRGFTVQKLAKINHVTQRSGLCPFRITSHFWLSDCPWKMPASLFQRVKTTALTLLIYVLLGYLFNLESFWALHSCKYWQFRVACRTFQARFHNARPSRTSFLSQQPISDFKETDNGLLFKVVGKCLTPY